MVKNNNIKYRVDMLENNLDKLDKKLDKIMTNDLPHLQMSLVELKTRINVLTAINVAAIIVAVVIQQMLK